MPAGWNLQDWIRGFILAFGLSVMFRLFEVVHSDRAIVLVLLAMTILGTQIAFMQRTGSKSD